MCTFLYGPTKFCALWRFRGAASCVSRHAPRVCGTNRNNTDCGERDVVRGICEGCFARLIGERKEFAGVVRAAWRASFRDRPAAAYPWESVRRCARRDTGQATLGYEIASIAAHEDVG